MPKDKTFSINRFLGLHETKYGGTNLKAGEASKMENFYITDDGHLTVRQASKCLRVNENILDVLVGAWSGYLGDEEFLITAVTNKYEPAGGFFKIYKKDGDQISDLQTIYFPHMHPTRMHFFTFSNYLYALSNAGYWRLQRENDGFSMTIVEGYIPTVLINTKPTGGGTSLQNINRLTGKRRVRYDADGTSTAFVLPEEATSVVSVSIDGAEKNLSAIGSFSLETHTFTMTFAPKKGINNVEIVYDVNNLLKARSRAKVIAMMFSEAYNGMADTRIFLYGDGTNTCIYSGITEAGDPSAEYFPELFEVRIDSNDSPITGMIRYQTRLIAFKPDGAFAIAYDAQTLADGTTIPAFYVRSLNRSLGNQAPGQVQSIMNYPRTLQNGTLYDWKLANYYQDERSAKVVSERVAETLSGADPQKVVAFDDNENKNYYLFLNDGSGTVLVHRYAQDVWLMYKGKPFQSVNFAGKLEGMVWFANEDCAIWAFSDGEYDTFFNGNQAQIKAVWESGYMDFGADYLRKNSSYLWVSMYPEPKSHVVVTVATDRRDAYLEKPVSANCMGYWNVDYDHWSYNSSKRPRVVRVKIKTKKYTHRKVIFSVTKAGARATILGFDQNVVYSGYAK